MEPAAQPEQRHHTRQAQVLVKVGAANVHAAAGQNIVLAFKPGGTLRAQPHQSKVRSTAADVNHQHQLFAAYLRLVVKGSGNRFVLKLDVL